MVRKVEEVQADLEAATAPRKKGELKNELIEAQAALIESLRDDQNLAEAFSDEAGSDGLNVTIEDRKMVAAALLGHHVARHGTAARPLQALVTAADGLMDAWQGLVEGGEYETLRTKNEDLSRMNSELTRKVADLTSRLEHRDEQVKEYMGRLQMANLPV